MAERLRLRLALWTAGLLLAIFVARFLAQGIATRRKIRKLPGPPHSWIWGHLKIMDEAIREVPARAHPHVVPSRIAKKYNLPNYFYLDLWPFMDTMFAVFDPDIAQQMTVDHVILKHYMIGETMREISGKGDMVSSDGPHWKKWRSIMNPGFAASHLMTLAAGIVDESVIFTDKLSQHAARNEVFRLEEDATRLTVDIIGKVALDVQLGTQRGEHELLEAMRSQVHLCPNEAVRSPLKMWWPWGVYRRWRNSQIMNGYLGRVLDERFGKEAMQGQGNGTAKQPRKRAIIDLALEAYKKETAGEKPTTTTTGASGIDAEFKLAAMTQIRTFVFAGHDTTSSTICYALYELSRHPEHLARLRAEHDAVLGPVAATPAAIKADPYLLNRLEYTNCVIREVLRLWPPASSTRTGDPGFRARDPRTGEPLETEGMLVWIVHYAMQRSAATWGPDADVFDPSRFLPQNAGKVPEGAWRAFERGPRNCIGQDLALLESRIILALVVRRFEFATAYGELAEVMRDGSKWAEDESFRRGKQDVDGEDAYQVLIGTAKPREGMPGRVREVL